MKPQPQAVSALVTPAPQPKLAYQPAAYRDRVQRRCGADFQNTGAQGRCAACTCFQFAGAEQPAPIVKKEQGEQQAMRQPFDDLPKPPQQFPTARAIRSLCWRCMRRRYKRRRRTTNCGSALGKLLLLPTPWISGRLVKLIKLFIIGSK